MEEPKPEAEISEEDLEKVTGGTDSAPAATLSNTLKKASDTSGGIIGNLK